MESQSLQSPLLPEEGKDTKKVRISAQITEIRSGSTKVADAVGSSSKLYVEDGSSDANTGGGRLYRCLMCGRKDKRKETEGGLKTKKASAFEGLDFDDFMNPVTEAHVRSQGRSSHKRVAAIRWILNFLIGVVVALVAVLIIYCTRVLTKWRFGAVYQLIDMEKVGEIPKGMSFIVFWLIGLVYAFVAALPVVFVEPASGGAGIPEVKMILNGVKMPRITRFKTLLCRVFGNIFSVSSGLPAGYEGPMVSIGAAISAGLSQGKSTTLGFDTRWSVYNEFRNDKEKRDFIVCGASAGISAAFNAPVGGVLFTYEESASFWHKSLTWRAFFAAMVSAYVIDLILSGVNDGSQWGKLSSPGMFNFGDFNLTGQTAHSWDIWELPLFIVMGALGGFCGAIFVQVNKWLTRFRISTVNTSRWRRLTDVVLVKTIISVFAFFIPYVLGTCAVIPPQGPDALYASSLVSFYCEKGQFNDIASFWFTPTEEAIRQLYHFTNGNPFSILHLGIFFVIYTSMMCLAAGTSVPAGLFIPTLLSGSALGRFVGETANQLLPAGMSVDAGTYSLIGSAAMLGGTTRMTISLAVILAEATGNYQYGLPIMMTLMAAKFFGNLFNHGLYDMQIELRKWPILEDRIPKTIANELRVSDVMTSDIMVFQEIEKVGRVLDVLQSTEISGFPVIYSEQMLKTHPRLGNLAGYIQRKHLAVILANKAFHKGLPSQLFLHNSAASVPQTPYPMPPVLKGSHAPSPESQPTTETSGGPASFLSPLSAPPATTQHWQRRFASVAGTPASTEEASVMDDTVSNKRALLAAMTGRSRVSVRHIRVASQLRMATGSERDLGHLRNRLKKGEQKNSILGLAFGSGATSINGEVSQGLEQEEAPPEPMQLQALYNALYEGEYRYPDEPLLLWKSFESSYPRYPDVNSIVLNAAEREMYIDLRPYMDPTPITVHIHCPLNRGFRIFRELGMRHLLVTNNCHDVVGIVSRSNLTLEFLKAVYDDAKQGDGGLDPSRLVTFHNVSTRKHPASPRVASRSPLEQGPPSPPSMRDMQLAESPTREHVLEESQPVPAQSPPEGEDQHWAADAPSQTPVQVNVVEPAQNAPVQYVDYEDTVDFPDNPDLRDDDAEAGTQNPLGDGYREI